MLEEKLGLLPEENSLLPDYWWSSMLHQGINWEFIFLKPKGEIYQDELRQLVENFKFINKTDPHFLRILTYFLHTSVLVMLNTFSKSSAQIFQNILTSCIVDILARFLTLDCQLNLLICLPCHWCHNDTFKGWRVWFLNDE